MGCCPARAPPGAPAGRRGRGPGRRSPPSACLPGRRRHLPAGERRGQPDDDGGRAVGPPDPPHPADEAVHRDRRLEEDQLPLLVGHDAAAVVMGEQHVVQRREEAHRRHDVRSGPGPVRDVNELATRFVAEGPKLRTVDVDHHAEPAQAAPGRDVADRGGTERGQIAQDELAGGVGAVERAAPPALGEDERGLAPPAPGAVRRRVQDRQQELRRAGQRRRVARPNALRCRRSSTGWSSGRSHT